MQLNVMDDLAEAMKALDEEKKKRLRRVYPERWTPCIDCYCSWVARTTGLFKNSTSKQHDSQMMLCEIKKLLSAFGFHKQDSKLCFLSEPIAFRGFTVLEVLLTDQRGIEQVAVCERHNSDVAPTEPWRRIEKIQSSRDRASEHKRPSEQKKNVCERTDRILLV